MKLTAILLITAFSMLGCRSFPEKPKGELCTHYLEEGIAICNDIPTGNPTADIPIAMTDKWIMVSPETWKNIMNYIDQLKRLAEEKGAVKLKAEDIQKLKETVNGRE